MIKKPEPGEGNATMQIDALGDLDGVQLDDNEASDAPASIPPSAGEGGHAKPPPLPVFTAQPPVHGAPPPSSASVAKSSRNVLVYGAIFVVVAIGITAGVKLGSALRGPAPVASVPSAVPSEPPAAAASAPSAAPTVMRLDTIEVRDPPADSK